MAGQRYSLAGKSVLITGAARGIGAESAKQIAARGARVALVGLEPAELERTASECGNDAIWFEVDVRDADALQAAVDQTVERFGGIDVAMANAGVAAASLVRDTSPAALELVLDINLTGAIRTLRMCLPHVLERRGYLLPVASLAAIGNAPALSAYCASKSGLEAFANSLRIEVRHLGVDVGVAYFSWIETEMVRGGDEREEFETLRGELRGPLAKTYPVSVAGAAVRRGIERRARWVTVPNWLRGPLVLRQLMQFGAEAGLRSRMERFDQAAAEAKARLGSDLEDPVGAGGRAAIEATSRD
jgi:NAD(P)-dependent dehydrogenase (short-subunit alcohol dehydrogenase family)